MLDHDAAVQLRQFCAVARRGVGDQAGEPAPARARVFFATTLGCPGRCLPRWRATIRMTWSLPPPGGAPTCSDTGLPAGNGAAAGCATAGCARWRRRRGEQQRVDEERPSHRGAGSMPFFRIAATEVSSIRNCASARAASGCLALAWMPVA